MTTQPVFASLVHNRNRFVHIVDSDLKTCELLSVVFRLEGFETTFSTDRETFLASLDRRRPDVVILNCEVSPEGAVDVLKRVKALRTGIPVFAIENSPMLEPAVQLMRAGASYVVSKPIDAERLLNLVTTELKKEMLIGEIKVAGRAIEVRGFASLSRREREILDHVVNGQTNKETGQDLGISARTVEVHRHTIMKKLRAKNLADLMRIVLTA